MTVAAELLINIRSVDVNAVALLQRVQVQGVTTNAGMNQLAGTMGGALKSSLLGLVGPAALVTGGLGAAVAVAKSFQDAFNFKTALDASTAAINDQLRGVRDIGQVWDEAGAFAKKYSLTQQETNDILRSSIDTMRASSSSVTELETALLRLQSRDVSKPISEAARAMRELQAGDVTSIKELFNVPAAEALKMKTAIAGGADGVKVLSDFLDRAGNGMEVLERRTQGAVGKMNELKKAQEDLVLAQAQFAQGPGLALLEERITLTRGATRAATGDFSVFSAALRQTAEEGTVLGAILQGTAIGFDALTVATGTSAAALEAQAAVTARQTAEGARQVSTIEQEIQAATAATTAIREATAATEAAAAQSLIDAQAKQTQTDQTGLLEAQATAAVNAFLVLNPSITASSAASATAAAGLSPLIAQLVQATLRATEATNALARFNALQGLRGVKAPAAGEAAGEVRGFQRSVREEALKRETDAAHAAAAAERAYQAEIKNFGPALARANAELAQLPEGSEAAWNKMIEIEKLKQQQASAARGKGAKAAGAAHLSDQQKLNNTLLTDQDRANDQMEAAQRAHDQRLLDIDRRFQKASLEQQKANELSKRSSELDFLKSITSSELNSTKEGRAEIQRINEQFYRDFAASQKAAQEGNLKQSEELAAQAKHRADVELQYANDIDKARRDKNASEVTRLTALRELERQLLAEQEKQIVEGGDPNVKARQEALDDEERNFAEQQGKIKTASDDATQRKIDNALREGKNVEALNLQYQQQEEILKRIGTRPPAPGTQAGGTGTAPAAPTTATPTPGTPVDLAALQAALQGMADQVSAAIASASGAIVAAEQGTTRAVRAASGDRAVI